MHNQNIIKYILFVPAFILSSLIVGYIGNSLIFPLAQWLARYFSNETSRDFLESDNSSYYVWVLICLKFFISVFTFTIPALLGAKIYPGTNKKPAIIIFLLITLFITSFMMYMMVIESPGMDLMTLNNIIVFIGLIVGFGSSFLGANEKSK